MQEILETKIEFTESKQAPIVVALEFSYYLRREVPRTSIAMQIPGTPEYLFSRALHEWHPD